MVKQAQPLWDKRSEARYTPEQCRAVAWFNINGDKTLRINYPLSAKSVVYDVGGYLGSWAEDIYKKYGCTIEIFEPIKEFSEKIERKFSSSPKVHLHSFGLSNKDARDTITREGPASSTHKTNTNIERIELKRAVDFIKKHHKKIDLMKINIEGDEYALIEDLIKSGVINNITDLQVQFHDFVPSASEKAQRLRDKLSKTHELTYYYPWIWENWRLKK